MLDPDKSFHFCLETMCVCDMLKHCTVDVFSNLSTASKKPGEPLIISDIKKGSMAHRYEQTLNNTG